MSIFFAVENGGQETQGHGAGQRVAAALFVLQARSCAIDRRRSMSQLPKLFLSRTKSTPGFEI